MLGILSFRSVVFLSVSMFVVSNAWASVAVPHDKKMKGNDDANVILVDKDIVSHAKNISVTDDSYNIESPSKGYNELDSQVVKQSSVTKNRFDSLGKIYIPKSFEEASRLSELRHGIKKHKISSVKSKVKENGISSLPVKNKEGISFLASVIYHSNGKSDLTKEDLRALEEVSKFVKKKSAHVLIVGHASSRTADMSMLSHKLINYDISVKRVNRIKDELMKNGLSAQDISLSAVSDTEPIQREVMPMSESINRRSEIYISY